MQAARSAGPDANADADADVLGRRRNLRLSELSGRRGNVRQPAAVPRRRSQLVEIWPVTDTYVFGGNSR